MGKIVSQISSFAFMIYIFFKISHFSDISPEKSFGRNEEVFLLPNLYSPHVVKGALQRRK